MVFIKILLAMFAVISLAKGQIGCPCHDPASGANWGRLRQNGTCEGTCDQASKNDSWVCVLPSGVELVCLRNVPCSQPDTCQGEWSQWTRIGRCNASCGQGFRRQERSCYQTLEVKIIKYVYRFFECWLCYLLNCF